LFVNVPAQKIRYPFVTIEIPEFNADASARKMSRIRV
jgi:hypothetical protein